MTCGILHTYCGVCLSTRGACPSKTVSFNALGIIQRVAQKPDTRQRRRDERSLEVDGPISEVVEWDWAWTRNCVYVDDLKALIDG